MSNVTMLGIDVGGTFTDVVCFADGRLHHSKTPTTPQDMRAGVEEAVRRIRDDLSEVDFIFHGTTAVINALLEADGAQVGLITTAGFRDVYEIGRGTRSEPFDMLFTREVAYVPRRRRREVRERMAADGTPLVPLDEDELLRVAGALRDDGVTSIAVSFLNGYANPAHEVRAAELIAERWPDIPVTTSHSLAREWREFERTSTAVMNAFVKPKMSHYVQELKAFLGELGFGGSLQLLQSNGGSASPGVASDQPLRLTESGPAAGIVGASALARQLGLGKILAFDMGGTTAKGGVIADYRPRTVRPYYIGGRNGLPSLLPVIDIVEVSAGGGSIARLDPAGALKVGPQSAAADPGPVCYRRGGTEPTITDAHLALGRLDAEGFLDGEMPLDRLEAREAIERRLAGPLGMSIDEAAIGILRIANTSMALALRQVSLARGHDPRELTLIASGGAGPLHAVDIARELSVPRVVIPVMPAHLSAYGMLLSDVRHERVRTVMGRLADQELAHTLALAAELEAELRDLVATDDSSANARVRWQIELCYEGQEHPLAVDVDGDPSTAQLAARFHAAHEEAYGFAVPGEPIRITAVRVDAAVALPKPDLHRIDPWAAAEKSATRRAFIGDGFCDATLHERERLPAGRPVEGPALIHEGTSTTVVGPGDVVRRDAHGNLLIELAA